MNDFPRTDVGGLSMPRLICGSNWLLGYSHTSLAKDRLIKDLFDTPGKLAEVIAVFARAGCNAFMSKPDDFVARALRDTEQKTGVPMLWVATPGYGHPGDPGTWRQSVEQAKRLGASFCFPHQAVTDPLVDKTRQTLAPLLLEHLREVREAGMIPGLSTHLPEAIACADACAGAVETYTQIYNAAGFLCQVETDWIQRQIELAQKPVMIIKPLAAGRLLPPTGLTFVWNTIRPCDMVTVGVMSAYEAEEIVELSLACLERRAAHVQLQYTRSKEGLRQ